ncbi:MAG: PEP-CTERM sorting domain-containing protein [Pseudomonadales bacterium]|nr:PEP-CTERM sorting domain-containing protein [Pseudomonadales bacterium]
MKLIRTLCASATLAMCIGTPAHSAVMFNFNYTDAAGIGFNAAGSTGVDRRGALQSAGDYISTFLTSYTANIFMDVNGAETGNSTLAAAGSNFNSVGASGFGNAGDVQRKILGGDAADPNASAADGTVTWNFEDFAWELGNDFQAGEFDFFSTAVHEILHALGFASEIQQNGNDAYGNAAGTTGNWTPFDNFIADASGDLINDVTFALDGARWSAVSVAGGTCGTGLLFTGANAMAANGGNAVEIYSPNPWEGGSSGSHMDDACYTIPGNVSTYMMEAQTIDGLGVRTISAVEVGMFRDIGYSEFGRTVTNDVPEPAIIYLLTAGLLLLGVRRRQYS